MIFPGAARFPADEPWVMELAARVGLSVPAGAATINLPRHPSQLYEALFEGIVLWAVIWFVFRKRKPFNGFVSAAYSIGYGIVRFVIEYFREPDVDIGYRFSVTGSDAPTYRFESLLNISTGQILCLLMILAGIAFIAAGHAKARGRREGAR